MQSIVLASSSKYRCDLLRKLRLDFIACASNIDESPLPAELPEQLVTRLSIAKANAISATYPDHLIIGSDQIAAFGSTVLGKPGNRENAIRQLSAQSGKVIRFYTGICVLNNRTGQCLTDIDICDVHFKQLDAGKIQRYLDADQPYDCAGSFKSEGLGIALFSKIGGEDPNALIGLPLIKLVSLLDQCGVAVP